MSTLLICQDGLYNLILGETQGLLLMLAFFFRGWVGGVAYMYIVFSEAE